MPEEFDVGLLEELYNDAEALLEEATSYAQIGKFSSHTSCHIWDGQMREVEPQEWRAFNPVPGQSFKFLNLNVSVDTQEFAPDGYEYERRIQVKRGPWNKRKPDGTYEKVKSDWFAIWEPSVKAVVPDYESMAKALQWLEGKYVKALDVMQQPTKRQPEPQYKTAKLVEVYDSREEAYAAYQALRSGGGNDSEAVPTGNDYDQGIIDGVKTLHGLNKTHEQIAQSLGLTVEDVQNILG